MFEIGISINLDESIVIEDENIDNDTLNNNNLDNTNDLEKNNPIDEITTLPDFWEKADKGELLFLLDNLKNTNSLVLDNILINKFTANSLPPQGFEEDEFNHFKIINLIKLGQIKKAFDMIETINEKTKKKELKNEQK